MTRLKDLLDPSEAASLDAIRERAEVTAPDVNYLRLTKQQFDEYLGAYLAAVVQERVTAGDSMSAALKAAQENGYLKQHAWDLKAALTARNAMKHERILKRNGKYADYDD